MYGIEYRSNKQNCIHFKPTERPTVDELDEFLGEIETMKKVGFHPNVVSFLGCCTIRQPFLMVMEYVGCGDLVRIFLKNNIIMIILLHKFTMICFLFNYIFEAAIFEKNSWKT